MLGHGNRSFPCSGRTIFLDQEGNQGDKEALKVPFAPREQQEQFKVTYKFLTSGLDLEDMDYLKRSYEMMLRNAEGKDSGLGWINETHWVARPVSFLPKTNNNITGSCRTEGFKAKPHNSRGGSAAFALLAQLFVVL